MKRFFSHRQMARLLDLPETRIRNWARIGLVPHSGERQGQLLFDFRGVVALRTLRQLLDQGVSIRRIRKCVETLRQEIPEVGEPLSEIRVYALGDQIVLRKDNLTFTPDGQLMIDFREEASPVIPYAAGSRRASLRQGGRACRTPGEPWRWTSRPTSPRSTTST